MTDQGCVGAGGGAGEADAGSHIAHPCAELQEARATSRWVTQSGSRPSGIARASRSAMPSRRSTWASSITPPSELIRPPSKAAAIFLRWTAGETERQKVIVGHGGRGVPRNPTPDQKLTLLPPPQIRPPSWIRWAKCAGAERFGARSSVNVWWPRAVDSQTPLRPPPLIARGPWEMPDAYAKSVGRAAQVEFDMQGSPA